MKSHTGTLILSGPNGCRSCAVPAALAETALFSTRAISQRQGPAWWTKNWNSTLYPVQRSVTQFWGALVLCCRFAWSLSSVSGTEGPGRACLNLRYSAFLGWVVGTGLQFKNYSQDTDEFYIQSQESHRCLVYIYGLPYMAFVFRQAGYKPRCCYCSFSMTSGPRFRYIA